MGGDDYLPVHKREGYAERMYEHGEFLRKAKKENDMLESKRQGAYYTDDKGKRIYYKDIARDIRQHHPKLEGQHIFAQLDALGLRDGFNKGHTACALPYSFTD